ncbi:MAG: DinB family protein [bacterium]|nr:DinB family protein [bacterium]
MYKTVDDYVTEYAADAQESQKMFDELTDASLRTAVGEGHRDLGRIAWHIVQSVPEMLSTAGVKLDTSVVEQPVPASGSEIAAAYKRVTAEAAAALRSQWDEAELERKRDMYGMQWSGAKVLLCLLGHEAHHRGQMSVLMRQAGLVPHGVYGPHKEAWATMGMEAPAI